MPGLNEADWNALEDKEAAMDWRLLEDATAINVGMGGIDWDAGPVIVMNESEDSITIRSEGQWNGLFDFEGTHVTFSTSSHWEIELDKEAVIDQIIFPAET
ncbi:hypothetical protein JCM19037_2648 [Geomicrobium sp. JCM 19037]|uniref:hypothetical protein n=1 Tax=Geomicrobium sp. JCM 19037 TaxID=1460634 RepID=UPI00045F34DD|nr:hypothetical protein [Geomicrobium sp. JCM 19037]GAK04259.1 hypothetical protein JCM19037_2648 [Geomicrobium sp. JCM 19037]